MVWKNSLASDFMMRATLGFVALCAEIGEKEAMRPNNAKLRALRLRRNSKHIY